MTTGHLPTEEITRDRKQPKKTSTNSSIAREVFDGQHRKQLEIPLFIDCYNHHMNSVDIANQLRATATVHFSRNEKEFFPGMFWAIDMILTNCWKIYESLYGPFLSSTQKRCRGVHREFLEALVELLFLCDSKIYAEMVPGTSFKEYPKYNYSPHKSGPKPQFSEPISQSLTDISRKTPFIFKGDSGRPRTSIPAKITPISRHQHIKTTTDGWCLICRNSNKIKDKRIAKKAYETIFQLSEKGFKEVISPSKDSLEESKRIRGRKTLWKCSECAVPICRPGEPCWNIAHKRLFSY
jgi:rubredoxin